MTTTDERGQGLVEWTFPGTRGTIAAARWLGDGEPRYVALITHGYGEHIGRYDHVAATLLDHGAVVYGLDHIGHGKSDGERVLIDDFEDVVTDVDTLADRAVADWPGLPVVLVGHSMGGLIAARYAQRYGHRLDAVILSGPVVGRLDFVDVLLSLDEIPDEPLDVSTLSRDPDVGARYAADPLVWHGPFKRPTLEAFRATLGTITDGGSLGDLPLLWLHGEDDQLVPIDGSRSGIADLRGGVFRERSYPGARHEIFNETNADEVLADVASFIDSVIGQGPPAAAPPITSPR